MKNQGKTVVAIIILIILIAGAAAYFVYQNKVERLANENSPTLSHEQAVALTKDWEGCPANEQCANKVTVSVSKKAGESYVTVIYEGLHDDSIAAKKYIAPVYYKDGTWTLGKPAITQQCMSDRGHEDFSSEYCN
jgi:hypothetical protein